jgi:hypothetical protein
LLHEALLSDLVVPVMLAQAPEHRSAARCAAHLAESTWLRPDLVVARREQFRPELGCVTGTPLLVVEVTSPASLDRDLGAKREMWARHGVPCYWVVRVSGEETHLHVFELQGDELVERARLTRGDTYWAHEPFKIELSPSALLQTVPAEMATTWRVKMSKHAQGLDLPAADEDIPADVFCTRWPTGAEKVELEDGCPVFYGAWDDRDVETAERTYPGRTVRLDQPAGEPGTLRVLPAPRKSPGVQPASVVHPRTAGLIKIDIPGDV